MHSTSSNSLGEVVCADLSSTDPTQLATPSTRPCRCTTPAMQASTCGAVRPRLEVLAHWGGTRPATEVHERGSFPCHAVARP